MTADSSVAVRFASGRENSRVLVVDAAAAELGSLRTVGGILKNDGSRLVRKISAATLAAAIQPAFNQGESEMFYVFGSIPRYAGHNKAAVQKHHAVTKSRSAALIHAVAKALLRSIWSLAEMGRIGSSRQPPPRGKLAEY